MAVEAALNRALRLWLEHGNLAQLKAKMPEDNRLNDDDKSPKKGGEFRVPPRTWIVWIAIFGGIIMLMLVKERMDTPGETLSQFKFQQLVESNMIAQAIINYSPQSPFLTEINGKYFKNDKDKE